MKLHKKRIRWGKFLLASLVAFGATVGLLKGGLTRAFEGDYWTTVDETGLSITVVSVEQNGLSLTPMSDGDGGYYFVTNNNTDMVTVDARVEGMQLGESYYYYRSSNNYSPSSKIYLTSDNNGDVISEELGPHVYFQDEDNCHGGCYDDPFDGVYYVGVSLSKENGSGVQKNIALHPASVGSQNIDIVSVQQNDVDLVLTNNEFQITNYNAPVEVTYKLKNLVIGRNYSIDFGDDYYNFVADATEKTETRQLNLDYVNRHVESDIYLYSSGTSEQVRLCFKIADASFKSLGDLIIDEISQGGTELTSEPDTSSGWRREYTFEANDAQGLVVSLRTTRAVADMNYYITYNMYGNGGGYLSSDEAIEVTGEELELGVVLPVSAAFGMGEYSPFTLNFSVNTTGTYYSSYGSRKVVYQDYGEYSSNDAFYFNFSENESVPRYDAMIYYSDGTMVDSDTIDPSRHDAEHPLIIEVLGERYNDEQTYNIRAKAKNENRETIYDHIFTATGAELNEGIPFTLEGLTLTLPEFDPNRSGSGGYEGMYDFSLEVDGLRQGGTMHYAYDGWVNSLITFDGGEVAAMGAGGGMGGSMFVISSGATIRKSSLDASKGAVLNYLCRGFEDGLSYDYALYYNGDTDEEWWSSEAGTLIDEGTLTGAELNSEGFSVSIATPSNESTGVMYTLVLTANDGLVKVVYDNLLFTEEPKIESFKFAADSDSFMQTDWSSYRVAKDTDILATLTGDGFDDETEYKLWVSYEGYRFGEENEFGESYPERVDLTELNDSVVVTGAQLNAGYEYNLDYAEALESVNFVEVEFAVTDVDVLEPDWSGMGNGNYAGHAIHVDYVNDDEVFRDNGYQINEDGTITDVSQPDDPHGDIPVDNRATGVANTIVEGGTLTVVSEKPVMVVGHRNNDEWVLLYEWDVVENGEERTNHYSIGDCTEVVVALKGNLKDDDTTIDLLDANVIYRSQLNPSSPAYKALTPVEEILADLNGDHTVDLLDANVIYRSQLNPSSPAYQEISW